LAFLYYSPNSDKKTIDSNTSKVSKSVIDTPTLENRNNLKKENLEKENTSSKQAKNDQGLIAIKHNNQSYNFFEEQVKYAQSYIKDKDLCKLIEMRMDKKDFKEFKRAPSFKNLVFNELEFNTADKTLFRIIDKETITDLDIIELEKTSKTHLLSSSQLVFLYSGLSRKNIGFATSYSKAYRHLNKVIKLHPTPQLHTIKIFLEIKLNYTNEKLYQSLQSFMLETNLESIESKTSKYILSKAGDNPVLHVIMMNYLNNLAAPKLKPLTSSLKEIFELNNFSLKKKEMISGISTTKELVAKSYRNKHYMPFITNDTVSVSLKKKFCSIVRKANQINTKCGPRFNSKSFLFVDTFIKPTTKAIQLGQCKKSSYSRQYKDYVKHL
jgi:hypothetical protein